MKKKHYFALDNDGKTFKCELRGRHGNCPELKSIQGFKSKKVGTLPFFTSVYEIRL